MSSCHDPGFPVHPVPGAKEMDAVLLCFIQWTSWWCRCDKGVPKIQGTEVAGEQTFTSI